MNCFSMSSSRMKRDNNSPVQVEEEREQVQKQQKEEFNPKDVVCPQLMKPGGNCNGNTNLFTEWEPKM